MFILDFVAEERVISIEKKVQNYPEQWMSDRICFEMKGEQGN